MTDRELPHESSLRLGAERSAALEHGLQLLSATWSDFDSARPHQPPVSPQTLQMLTAPLPESGVGVSAALDDAAVGENVVMALINHAGADALRDLRQMP